MDVYLNQNVMTRSYEFFKVISIDKHKHLVTLRHYGTNKELTITYELFRILFDMEVKA